MTTKTTTRGLELTTTVGVSQKNKLLNLNCTKINVVQFKKKNLRGKFVDRYYATKA